MDNSATRCIEQVSLLLKTINRLKMASKDCLAHLLRIYRIHINSDSRLQDTILLHNPKRMSNQIWPSHASLWTQMPTHKEKAIRKQRTTKHNQYQGSYKTRIRSHWSIIWIITRFIATSRTITFQLQQIRFITRHLMEPFLMTMMLFMMTKIVNQVLIASLLMTYST